MKTLHMDVECCLECPMRKFNYIEGYFYCSHVDSPEDHVIKRVTLKHKDNYIQDFEIIEDYLPEWCPLPEKLIIKVIGC